MAQGRSTPTSPFCWRVVSRLAVPPVTMTTIANWAVPVVPTDVERSAGQRDICRAIVHLPSETQNLFAHEILFLTIPWTGFHLISI